MIVGGDKVNRDGDVGNDVRHEGRRRRGRPQRRSVGVVMEDMEVGDVTVEGAGGPGVANLKGAAENRRRRRRRVLFSPHNKI